MKRPLEAFIPSNCNEMIHQRELGRNCLASDCGRLVGSQGDPGVRMKHLTEWTHHQLGPSLRISTAAAAVKVAAAGIVEAIHLMDPFHPRIV